MNFQLSEDLIGAVVKEVLKQLEPNATGEARLAPIAACSNLGIFPNMETAIAAANPL